MNLKDLNDCQLIISLKKCVEDEKKIIALVIEHLEEVERRKLYSELKYKNLFDYCMKELGYSHDQAYRRINAMRLSRNIPLVRKKLQQGELSLSNINMLSAHLKDNDITEKQQEKVVEAITNTSKRDCSMILDELLPRRSKPKSVSIRVSIELYEKLSVVMEDYGVDAEGALKLLLEFNEKRKIITEKVKKGRAVGKKRYIPKSVKLTALKRSNGKCQNCGSREKLQFDHIRPYAKGGQSKLENMRILCRNCNLREGIKVFGLKKMKRAGVERGS